MIYNEIQQGEFARWVRNSGSYQNNFSYDGANALQDYLEEMSVDIGENIEFDPIAWCCEYSEYESYEEAYKELGDGSITDPEEMKQFIDDNTMTYEFDGGIIVQDF